MEDLIRKYLRSELDEQEEKKLYRWVKEDKRNLEYFKARIIEHSFHEEDEVEVDTERSFQVLKARIDQTYKKPKVLKIQRLLKYAAVFTLIFSVGYYVITKTEKESVPSQNSMVNEDGSGDLSDEEITLVLEDGAKKTIQSDKEELSYYTPSTEAPEVEQIELVVPRGKVFRVVLSDSTVVWLNAESKLKYPSLFSENDKSRVVTLEGEGFFDVKHDENRPFKVKTDEIDVKVLGTRFNISSYSDHKTINTTLVEGSVVMSEKGSLDNTLTLQPNHQASFNKSDLSLSSKIVDVDQYTAWIDKRIVFSNMTFGQVMKRIERTYNVDVINNNKAIEKERFTGEFDRENIEVVFEALSTLMKFEYEINANKIMIKKQGV